MPTLPARGSRGCLGGGRAPGAPAALVDQGMEAYRAGAFDRAAEFLAAAAAREPSPGIQFFLGIARLKTGNVGAGTSALITALEPPGNPYAAEARLYLAKAWLALGDADSALTH